MANVSFEKVKKTYNKAIVCGVYEYFLPGAGWQCCRVSSTESELKKYVEKLIGYGAIHFCLEVRQTWPHSGVSQIVTTDFSANELLQ